MYCAAAGFHPARVLPCVIDVGTDNEALRNDPMYMGLQHPRLQGDAYFEVCCAHKHIAHMFACLQCADVLTSIHWTSSRVLPKKHCSHTELPGHIVLQHMKRS